MYIIGECHVFFQQRKNAFAGIRISTHRRRREEVKRLLVLAGKLPCSTGSAHKPARKEQAQARPLNSDTKVGLTETQHLKSLQQSRRRERQG